MSPNCCRGASWPALVAALGLLASALRAEAGPTETLVHDGFDGTSTVSWRTGGGLWMGSRGWLTQHDPHVEAYRWVDTVACDDCVVEARLMLDPAGDVGEGERCGGIVARFLDPGSHYLADICGKHQEVRLWRRVRGEWTEIASTSARVEDDTWYVLTLTTVGDELSVALDGATVIHAEDDALASGFAGLRTSQGRVSYDNFYLDRTSARPSAPTPTPAPDRLLWDGFAGALSPSWTTIGTWSTSGGHLRQRLRGAWSDVMAWREGIYCADCTVTTRARLDSAGAGELGLLARVRSRSDLYLFDVRAGSQEARLWRRADGRWSGLASAPCAVEVGRWYHLAFQVEGNVLRGFVDHRPVVEARDEAHAFGMAGLRTGDATGRFDWVTLDGAGLPVRPTATPAPEIDLHPDLDALYIERTPRQPWNAERNWPDVGQTVHFRLHVANKGGKAAGPFAVRWETLSPDGTVLAGSTVETDHPALPAGGRTTSGYERSGAPAAWGDGRWRDGPYRVRAVVDSRAAVDEGPFEHNNDLSDYTNALAIGFMVEPDAYAGMNARRSGLESDVPPGSRDGGFAWFSRPAGTPAFRAGTWSWEDWAQRQVAQLNEYFFHAEDTFFGGRRNRLIRVRLDRVDLVESGGTDVYGHNFPYGDSAEGWALDAAWGFAGFSPVYTVLPQMMVVETSLLHEVAHHLGRHHIDLGRGRILLDDRVLGDYPGDVRWKQSPMANTDYSKGWSEYTALGFDYEFQRKPGRDVPERIGSQNPGTGLSSLPPRGSGHYWDPFLDLEQARGWRSEPGNGRWVLYEVPRSPSFLVADATGAGVAGALVEIFRAAPGRDTLPEVWRFQSPATVSGRTGGRGIVRFEGFDPLSDGTDPPARRPLTALARVTVGDDSAWRVVDVMHLNQAFRRDPADPPPIVLDTAIDGSVAPWPVVATPMPTAPPTSTPGGPAACRALYLPRTARSATAAR